MLSYCRLLRDSIMAAACLITPAIAIASNQLFVRAYDLLEQGEINVAIAMFQEGLRAEPDNGLAHLYLGNALMAKRPPDEAAAIIHYKRAAELMPGSPEGIEANARLNVLQEKAGEAQAKVQAMLGSWELSQRCSWGSTTDTFRIADLAQNGLVTLSEWAGRGSLENFRIVGGRVSFTIVIQVLFTTNTARFSGQVIGQGQMSGTYTQSTSPETCSWVARKTG